MVSRLPTLNLTPLKTHAHPQALNTMPNFDEPIDRRHHHSYKWTRYDDGDVIPLWVADMDFRPPAAVSDALQQQLQHGVFGYTNDPIAELNAATIDYVKALHGWSINAEWLVWLPSMVTGFNLACRIAGERGDGIACALPVYPPMRSAALHAERTAVTIPMRLRRERWILDFDALSANLSAQTRMLLFCNPHNPGGTVYTREELDTLHHIAQRHDLLICSDEIHGDLVLDPQAKHLPFGSLNDDAAQRSVTLMAASKTYNIAGLCCGFAIIPNTRLRQRYKQAMRGLITHVNVFGQIATHAAFRHGAAWRQALLDYLRGNLALIIEQLGNLPGVKLYRPEASFLVWMDVSALNLNDPAAYFLQQGVAFSPGADFGDPHCLRFNFGCTRGTLRTALHRIRQAIDALGPR